MSTTATSNRIENLQTLRAANLDAAFATAFASLVSGAFLTGFINHLGGNDFWINLAAALPALAGLFQIPGGILGRRAISYKKFVAPYGFGWRLFYVPLCILPFFPMPDPVKLVLVLIAVTLAAISGSMVGPTYNEWLANLVPSTSRGFYFARRNSMLSATGAIAGLAGALMLDFFKKSNQQELGFTLVFALGVLFGFTSFYFYMRMHDLTRENPVRKPIGPALAELRAPFVDKGFRRVLVFLIFFIFGQAFAGNLFAAFAIKSLDLPYTVIQWAGVMHALGNVLSGKFWGFVADKYGNKPVLYIVGAGLTLTPTMWLFCVPNQTTFNAVILLPSHILVGATWAGVALCQYNLLLATANTEDRANYLSVTLTVQSVVGFCAPLLGAHLLRSFEGMLAMDMAYKAVFGVTMGLRLFGLFWLLPVKEEGALHIRRTLRDLSRLTPKGLRAMRDLSTGDSSTRTQALENLGHNRTSLAVEEVAKALHDPTPKVRREAANTLAKLNDPDAAWALIHQLEEHPDLVEEETVEALGQIGGESAIPVLVQLLDNPRSLLRRAAARSLSRIGSPDVIPPLIEVAKRPDDPDLRRTALQALRQLEATEADQVIADALFDPTPSVRIAAAEAVSEMELERALPYARQSIRYYEDEAAAEVAYALGVVGTTEDLPIILEIAQRSRSMIPRRRCLMGAARILGVESEAYQLMMAEDMVRDQKLMTLLGPAMKGNKRLRDALAMFSSGEEGAALGQLVPQRRFPELDIFAEIPVDEGFLVAAAFIGTTR
jgi:HEAT repeat protein